MLPARLFPALLFAQLAPATLVHGQWAPANLPGLPMNIQHIHANATRDTIYYCGALPLTLPYWYQSNAVMRYSGGHWDALGVLNGFVFSIVMHNDTLIAGGQLAEASGTPCSGAAFWDGTAWQPYGDFGTGAIRMLRVLDGELYAVGDFLVADGQPASGVAKRSESGWGPVGGFDLQGSIIDITRYNEDLIVIGNVDIDGGTGIARWDGTNWHLLGPGIVNGLSGGQCLAVYQGDLYVGGQIALAPGNPGQNIMRWDGSQFHALGQGIQQELGNTTGIAMVRELVVHDGLLFVGGGFRAAGGILANGLATWDGSEWCAVPGDFTSAAGLWAMDFYHDTLFVATGVVLDGDTVNRAAKFVGHEYRAECSGPVAVPEELPGHAWSIHPNPGNDLLWAQGPKRTPYSLTIRDASGRMLRTEYEADLGVPIRMEEWPSGIYLIEVRTVDGVQHTTRWVKQ